MSEEIEEGPITTSEMYKPLGEIEEQPTSIDVTDEQISTGEEPLTESQEEKVQELNRKIEQAQEEPKIRERKQRRRITSYLSNISKQVEKNGNQINKITMTVQSIIQKQKQTESTKGPGVSQSPLQSIKQIQSQVSQLQKQVTRIQKDIQRIRITSGSRTTIRAKFKRLISSSANVRPRSKKSKSLKSNKMSRSRKSR